MITIPLEIKPLLNTLIRYERRSHKDNAYVPKNFVLDDKGVPICHITTLSKIENNHHMGSDRLYFELLKKLNKSFLYDEKVNKLLHSANRKLLKHAEVNDTAKINNILRKTSSMLNTYKGCIYYDTLSEIYQILSMYYKNQSFDKTLLDKYIELFDVIPEELKAIFIFIAYHYYSRVNIDETQSVEITNKSFSLKIESILKIYWKTVYYVRSNHLIRAKELCESGAKMAQDNNNNYYLVRFYNLLAIVYRYDDPQKAIYYLTMCIAHFDKKNDSYSTLTAFYQNLCFLAYDREDFTTIMYIYKKHLYEDFLFMTGFFYILIRCIYKTTKDLEEINRILYIVEKHAKSSDAAEFHLILIDFYKCIYLNDTNLNILSLLKELQIYSDDLINETILKTVIIDSVKDYCILNNSLHIYKECMDFFNNLHN